MKKLLVPALLTLIVAVATYGGWQLYLLYKATFKIIGTKIKNIAFNNIDIVLYTELDNKGDISAQVYEQHYDVFFNGKKVSDIDAKEIIHINSNGKSIIPIRIAFNPEKIVAEGLSNLIQILTDRSKITLQVRGYLSLKSGIVSMKKYPIDIKYTLQELIDISKEPKVTA